MHHHTLFVAQNDIAGHHGNPTTGDGLVDPDIGKVFLMGSAVGTPAVYRQAQLLDMRRIS